MKPKTVRLLHTYLGLSSGIFFLLLGITGILLTFRGFFSVPKPTVPQELQEAKELGIEELVQIAQTKINADVAYISFPKKPAQPIRIRFRDSYSTTLYQAPNGTIVGQTDNREFSFNRFVFDLHTGAILGRPGELFIALIGLFLIMSLVTGTILWPWLSKLRKRKNRIKTASLKTP